MRIGLREANQRFSKAVRAVKAGEEVILTERGRPIAVLKPFTEPEHGGAAVRRLEAAGLLRPAAKAGRMPPWRLRTLRGAPMSRTLRVERDAS